MDNFKFYMLTTDCVMVPKSMSLEAAKKWYFSEILGDDMLENYDEEEFYEIKFQDIKHKIVVEEEEIDSPERSVEDIVKGLVENKESLPAMIYATEW